MTSEVPRRTIDSPSMRHALDMQNRTQIILTATGEMTAAFEALGEGRPAQWQSL